MRRKAAWILALAVVIAVAGCSDEPSAGGGASGSHAVGPTTTGPDFGRRFCEASVRLHAIDALLAQRPALADDDGVRADYQTMRDDLKRTAPAGLRHDAADVIVAADARVEGQKPSAAETKEARAAARTIRHRCSPSP